MDVFDDTIPALDGITEGTGLNVKPVESLLDEKHPTGFDDKLENILDQLYLFGMNGGLGYGKFEDELSPRDAKQAIKQLIASHLGAIIDDNMYPDFDANGSDLSSVYESIIEWLGELQGGGNE